MDPFDQSSLTYRYYSLLPPVEPLPPEMEVAVRSVERILNYRFQKKKLLEEALTHSSCNGLTSFERLEFLGDSVLGLALANHVFMAYPNLDPGQLSLLRAANVSTEKLARVAVRHGLYQYVKKFNAAALDAKIAEFVRSVQAEKSTIMYVGDVKAPKFLADIVESVAAAVYVDVNFDLQRLWVIFRGFLEPIITLTDLEKQPEPVSLLFDLCRKQGKQLEIKYGMQGSKTVAAIYIDDAFVGSGSSEQKDIARLNAVEAALHKLLKSKTKKLEILQFYEGLEGETEIETGKQKLHDLCCKKKWPKPSYRIEKDFGPNHATRYTCSVRIPIDEGILYMKGDAKPRVKEAEHSAASWMIRALQDSKYL